MKKTNSRLILSIETSCDETAMALVRCSGTLKSPKFEVLKNIVSSQIAIHRPFGGVVPNLAKREHIKNLPKIWKRIMNNESGSKNGKKKSIIHNSKFSIRDIDFIAVTVGPGLEPALWTGINFAQELEKKYGVPVIGANHMEGHLYSGLLPKIAVISKSQSPISKVKGQRLKVKGSGVQFPAIALVVSGGHTILLRMTAINRWTKLGETLDDAAGEAFDKVARILGLPYPGGPEIQKTAAKGNPEAVKFPRPMLNKKNYEFSFSGLKTSVLYFLRDNPSFNKADIAASFQRAAIDVLTKKTIRAVEEFNAKTVLLCGGVSANRPLQESLRNESERLKVKFIVPDFEYNTDNAAMIAVAGYMSLLGRKKKLLMEAQGNLTI